MVFSTRRQFVVHNLIKYKGNMSIVKVKSALGGRITANDFQGIGLFRHLLVHPGRRDGLIIKRIW
jgi:hypothetical protein